MVAKIIMGDEEFCDSCMQRHDCREIYGKMGHSAGPPVTLGVVIVFLAPILIFICTLASVEWILGRFTDAAAVQTGAGLAAAAITTFLWILAARRITSRLGASKR